MSITNEKGEDMLKKVSGACERLISRFLPDPFLFCVILTVLVFIGSLAVTGAGVVDTVAGWGSGVWGLLAFSMQMALVLVLGSALANAAIVKKVIETVAGIAKTPIQGIVVVTAVSLICCWLNWGFGLVIGAILAKEIARKVKGIDYRLLIASAYTGFVVWHAGISGSIPLALATPGEEALLKATGGAVSEAISTSMTIFAPYNIFALVVILVGLPLINAKMHPSKDKVFVVDPALLEEKAVEKKEATTPAEKLENNPICSLIIVLAGFVFLINYFMKNGFNLSLDIVNMIFLVLGLLAHKTPINYVNAVGEAAKGTAGIILQFPFYAGIMALMTFAPNGVSLASVISNFFVSISTRVTFPLFSFLSAGIINFFVPSGGGQWAVQGPIMMPAGLELGVHPSITGMTIAWGDAWTNMIQPFWALPALGIAGLSARDIMGYCVIALFFSGIVVCAAFLLAGFGFLLPF